MLSQLRVSGRQKQRDPRKTNPPGLKLVREPGTVDIITSLSPDSKIHAESQLELSGVINACHYKLGKFLSV